MEFQFKVQKYQTDAVQAVVKILLQKQRPSNNNDGAWHYLLKDHLALVSAKINHLILGHLPS